MIMQIQSATPINNFDYYLWAGAGFFSALITVGIIAFRVDPSLFKDIPGNVRRYRQSVADMDPRARRAWYLTMAAVVLMAIVGDVCAHVTAGQPGLPKLEVFALSLLPVIPLAFIVYGTVAIYRFSDELQQRVMTEGALVSVPFSVIVLFIFGAAVAAEPALGRATTVSVPILGWTIGMLRAWKRNTGSALGIPGDA